MVNSQIQDSLLELGKKIADARKRYNLTQRELAEIARVSDSTVFKIEKGNDCRLNSMYLVCDALNLEFTVSFKDGAEPKTLEEQSINPYPDLSIDELHIGLCRHDVELSTNVHNIEKLYYLPCIPLARTKKGNIKVVMFGSRFDRESEKKSIRYFDESKIV